MYAQVLERIVRCNDRNDDDRQNNYNHREKEDSTRNVHSLPVSVVAAVTAMTDDAAVDSWFLCSKSTVFEMLRSAPLVPS
eukprot:CAMPEP_0178747626 /NCGR_PEP_ID=MMETSP0744-20121128/8420_1 /TAXON_ID=913974 /ORGANISM="Nitzschia punctata, Strain CCMP561" /LENGTH=79 /DNA_ID=CAMNT_0020400871 /DNA_START=113 /DNA_END=352 /DNA_ORIENTATION=+